MPGSGTYGFGYSPIDLGYTPGSGSENHYSPGVTPGTGSGEATADHFEASFGSDGTISIKLPGATETTGSDQSSAISLVIMKYKSVSVVIVGICVITAILSLLFQITKLGAAGDNEQMRAAALKGIIYSGVVLSIFGALGIFVGLFWNILG